MDILLKIKDLFVGKVYADSLGSEIAGSVGNLEGSTDQNDLVSNIVEIAIPLAIACAVLLLIYGGYMLMSSQGNPDKLQEARSVITNAIIGLLVILLSTAILVILSNTLGLDIYS